MGLYETIFKMELTKKCHPCTCLDSNDIIHRRGNWHMAQWLDQHIICVVCLNLNLVKMLHANMWHLRGYRQHSLGSQLQPADIRHQHYCCPWSTCLNCTYSPKPGSLSVVCSCVSLFFNSLLMSIHTSHQYSVIITTWGFHQQQHHHQWCYTC